MPRRWQYSQNELLCTGMSTKENQEITSSSLKVLPDLSSMAQLAQIPEESLNEDEVSQLMREVCEVQKKLVLFG